MSQAPGQPLDAAQWDKAMTAFQTGYATADAFSGRWEPAVDTDLTVIVKTIHRGVGAQDGAPIWRVEVECLDGLDPKNGEPYTGKSFSPWWFSAVANRAGWLKGFLQQLKGRVVNSLPEADAALNSCIGTALRIRGKEGPKGSNWFVNEVIAAAPAEQPAATPTSAPPATAVEPPAATADAAAAPAGSAAPPADPDEEGK